MADWSRRLRTARAKATIGVTGAVAIVLIAAGVTALNLQRASLVNAIDTALVARADDLSVLLVDGSIPTQLTVPGDEAALVQIVGSDGTVLATSANISGEGPISEIRPPQGDTVILNSILPIGEGEFRLAISTVPAHDQAFAVYVAASLEPVSGAVRILRAILLVGIPLLLAFVGVTVWFIVGRTLHPIEAIRGEVASIGDRELDRRVPVPDTNDEVARLALTMNDMLGRLEQSSERQRRFVADASHELRSPLAAIRAQLEVDLVHPAQADWEAANTEILEEALRMQRLIDDLLLLARSDTGTLPTLKSPLDLDDLIFREIARLSPTDRIAIDMTGVSGAQTTGDPEALSRLIRNLLENALRYAKSRTVVSLNETHGTIVLTIDDDGPGIPSADRIRVFDRFTRLDEARDRDHGGSGLGLAISREIAQHHDGTITIHGNDLGGTRVSVEFRSSIVADQ